ncbi:MAG: hypothetical protein H7Y88_11950 [Phycisphaerales bacterium]|nr:hypothetical protein [Phycisphaerales bacterium]
MSNPPPAPPSTATPSTAAPPTSAAPPTRPGALPPIESQWPRVLGVSCIVLSALGVIGELVSLAGAFLATDSRTMNARTPAVARAIEDEMPLQAALAGVGAILSVWLLASGIGLMMRRRWSVSSLRSWSILRILWVIASISLMVIGPLVSAEQASRATRTADPSQATTSALWLVFLIIPLGWGLALPVFSLIWLSRPKIKAETAGWH